MAGLTQRLTVLERRMLERLKAAEARALRALTDETLLQLWTAMKESSEEQEDALQEALTPKQWGAIEAMLQRHEFEVHDGA